MEVVFKSKLPVEMRSQLESVFYFNQGQTQWHGEIRTVVERYGVPEISEAGTHITLAVRGEQRVQTLFALGPTNHLEGVIIYGRFFYPEILIMHIAIARSGSIASRAAEQQPSGVDFLELMTAFNKLIKTIAGAERMRFAYWDIVIPLT